MEGRDTLSQPMVLVDIETNGMNHQRGRIIEVAAIRIENGEIVDEFQTLLNPDIDIPHFITKLTGITNSDIADAPTFGDISDDLLQILDGAIFVAHNVRFDYSFLKQEFARVGIAFSPQQLCTVRLSRALYPEYKSHKLASLIERHNFSYNERHRAYDDAFVLWQFIKHVRTKFDATSIRTAVSNQLRHPSLPKHLSREVIDTLPTSFGVYIFEDETGAPLYIGKSINIRTRAMSHFTRDTKEYREFKMAQNVHNISFHQTNGELEALLLESHLIKSLQPLYNRMLRRVRKLTVAKMRRDTSGYIHVFLETLDEIAPDDFDFILATYPRRSSAKSSILAAVKTFGLCPKLSGLEKTKKACFSRQLDKCKGACVGKEPAHQYNSRVLSAFEYKRIEDWPFSSPILLRENAVSSPSISSYVVDQWRIIGKITKEENCDPTFERYETRFDVDAYKILRQFMKDATKNISIEPISVEQLHAL
jgi:DNA polymerase III subunit epsilon